MTKEEFIKLPEEEQKKLVIKRWKQVQCISMLVEHYTKDINLKIKAHRDYETATEILRKLERI